MAKRKRVGRPRKANKPTDPMDMRAGVRRHPNGSTVRDDRPGPHERHLEIRSAMGYDRSEHCEVDHVLYRLSYLSTQQRDAGLRFDRDHYHWLISIGMKPPGGIDMEGSRGGGSGEPTPFDERAKDRYLKALNVLHDSGSSTKRAILTLITQGIAPPDDVEVIHGLNALARYYEKGIMNAA